jgi:hypothetical protein
MSNIDRRVVASATGASGSLELPAGREYHISFTSAGAFALTLQQLAGDRTTWRDAYRGSDKASVDSTSTTTPLDFVVGGGTYRMNVSTYNNPITMWALPV